MSIAGFTSTGSKHPSVFFGEPYEGMPLRITAAQGCRVTSDEGLNLLDFSMALGAVALGYGHPAVDHAVVEAVGRGAVGPLAPTDEEALAAELAQPMPVCETVRFFKTGAEAVAAAVRLARVATARDRVLGCGYHGWLDWCSRDLGVPEAVQALYQPLPFNDEERARALIRQHGDRLACVVIEPVVEAPPRKDWLDVLREETRRVGALLIFDEIKSALRVALGGAAERWGGDPDVVVLGKAIANGFPLAVVGGRSEVMQGVDRTWISSTLATEFVSLAAARATLRVARQEDLPGHIAHVGGALMEGLRALVTRYPGRLLGVGGIPEMCFLRFVDDKASSQVAQGCVRRGVLFKRTAYNFVSLAHDTAAVASGLAALDQALAELR